MDRPMNNTHSWAKIEWKKLKWFDPSINNDLSYLFQLLFPFVIRFICRNGHAQNNIVAYLLCGILNTYILISFRIKLLENGFDSILFSLV